MWALPFLSVLAPSERYAAQRGKKHKKITDWAWQMLLLVRRWWPERQIVAVADSTYASLKLLDRCRSLSQPVTFITRLRLDAALYEPAPPRRPGQLGRPRLKGERLPNLSVVAEDSSTGLEVHHGNRLVRQSRAYAGDDLRNGGVVQHGAGSCAHTLGSGARSTRGVRYPSLAVHRAWGQTEQILRGSANRRVTYASRNDGKAIENHSESCQV